MKRILILLACGWLLAAPCDVSAAASGREKKKPKADTTAVAKRKRPGKYEKLFRNKKVSTVKGMITMHRIGEKLYFEFPLALMDREFLLGTAVSATSDNRNALVGQQTHTPLHVRFRVIDSMVCLQQVTAPSRMRSHSDEPNLREAVALNTLVPQLHAWKAAAYNRDSTAVVFDVTKFLLEDNKLLPPFDPDGPITGYGKLTRTATFKKNDSYADTFLSFDDNLSVSAWFTYYQVLTRKNSMQRVEGPVTMRVTRSLLLLPEADSLMPIRLADPRVGYFYSWRQHIGTGVDRITRDRFIHKWAIAPRDTAAWKRGELTEVAEPVVFYIDDAFPAAWRGAVKEGVEVWNRAFERIGLKGAVVTRDFPKNDPEFDPENLKYTCVRYAPSGVENAMGPSWVDPRNGQIINASVFVYHDIVHLINAMRFVQTAQIDERVRTPKLPDDILCESIRNVVSHEVGHCLGLMHNMAGSAAIPSESLRSPSATNIHGTTASIMDYARYNYVAQPGDRGVRLTPPELGAYDYFAIEAGYRPVPDAATPEETLAEVQRWIAARAGDPFYRYGKQQVYAEYDPTALAEDLGDDAMVSGRYGVRNLKYILQNMNAWLDGSDPDYEYRMDIYPRLAQQLALYLSNAWVNVGGFRLNERLAGDPGAAWEAVPRQRQREAVRWVIGELRTAGWIDAPEVSEKLRVGTPYSTRILKAFAPRLVDTKRVSLGGLRDPEGYTPREYLDDLYREVWATTLRGGSLSPEERTLQYEVVCAILKKLQRPNNWDKPRKKGSVAIETLGREAGFGFRQPVTNIAADAQAHLWHALLIRAQRLMESRLGSGDFETRQHYGFLLEKIEDIRNW